MTSDLRDTLRERPKPGRTPAKTAFGLALKGLRLARGLKQAEIARATGLTKAMISSFELGKVYPSLESLLTYLGGVGCNLGDLQRHLDMVAGPPPFAPSAEDVYRVLGEKVARAIEEVCQELGVAATDSSSQEPPRG